MTPPCACVRPLDPAVAATVARVQHPACPAHGDGGEWKVIPG